MIFRQAFKLVFIFFVTLLLATCNRSTVDQQMQIEDLPTANFDVLTQLPRTLSETSGLMYIDGDLWTHNDSGSEAALYKMNPETGSIQQTVLVPNSKNVDWEDITSDSAFVYVGDFGNNLGKRRDLKIYKFPKLCLSTGFDSVKVEVIAFTYLEQEVFPGDYGHNFDAESLIVYGDSLYIFSKNWENNKCKIYQLPKTPGLWNAKLIATHNTKGLITGADYNSKSEEIALIGYRFIGKNSFDAFSIMLSGFTAPNFFSGSIRKSKLDLKRQVEGISVGDSTNYFFSAENEGLGSSTLYQLSF